MNIIKFCICVFLFFSLSNCETIDKKVTETTEKENKILSKFLGAKSDVVKNKFGEPDTINLESPYKVYVYNKKNLLNYMQQRVLYKSQNRYRRKI
jgi:hypothetical protein